MKNITIYHKDYCPYCKAAKKLLSEQGFEYNEIEVTDDPEAFSQMVTLSNRKTVPQIFVGRSHVGGYDDLNDLYKRRKFPFNNKNKR